MVRDVAALKDFELIKRDVQVRGKQRGAAVKFIWRYPSGIYLQTYLRAGAPSNQEGARGKWVCVRKDCWESFLVEDLGLSPDIARYFVKLCNYLGRRLNKENRHFLSQNLDGLVALCRRERGVENGFSSFLSLLSHPRVAPVVADGLAGLFDAVTRAIGGGKENVGGSNNSQ